MKNKLIVVMIVVAAILLVGVSFNLTGASIKNIEKVVILQEENEEEVSDNVDDKKEGEIGSEEEEELEEEEEEWLDYELGKVDPQTKKATRYVCKGCGEVMLQPFKCEICEKDAEKEELEVEEKNGKWYIKGTDTRVVEKEPEEEEELPEEEKESTEEEGSTGGGK